MVTWSPFPRVSRILPNNSILIPDIRVSETGIYTCTAVNSVGSDSRNSSVTVRGLDYVNYVLFYLRDRIHCVNYFTIRHYTSNIHIKISRLRHIQFLSPVSLLPRSCTNNFPIFLSPYLPQLFTVVCPDGLTGVTAQRCAAQERGYAPAPVQSPNHHTPEWGAWGVRRMPGLVTLPLVQVR